MATALCDTENYSVKKLATLTQIDPWFLSKMDNIIKMMKKLQTIDYKVVYSVNMYKELLLRIVLLSRIFPEKLFWRQNVWDFLTSKLLFM